MASRRWDPALKRAARVRTRAQALMLSTESKAAGEVARTAVALAARATGLMRHLGSTSPARTIQALDQMIRAAEVATIRNVLNAHSAMFDISLAAHIGQVEAFDLVSPRQILALSQQFRGEFQSRLRTENYQAWIERMPAESLSPVSTLREHLNRVVVDGRDPKVVAREWVAEAKFDRVIRTGGQIMRADVVMTELPSISSNIVSPLRRAIRVLRTELGRLDNVVGITFAEGAGFTHFVNMGVGDDHQSEICAQATLQDPHTIAWWASSEFRVAPRHPFCRCAMCAVPSSMTSNLDPPAIEGLGLVGDNWTD